jgi:mRNA-degrading endonuclease RelE of RelBE toxin-antitoxin system
VPTHVQISRRAQRDLRALKGTRDLVRVLDALDRLAEQSENLDVKPLQGAAPWLRLRVGDFRIVYRPLTSIELQAIRPRATAGFLVARIVNRRDLDRAIGSL